MDVNTVVETSHYFKKSKDLNLGVSNVEGIQMPAKRIPIQEEYFSPSVGHGVTLTADFAEHRKLERKAIEWVNSQRVYLKPDVSTLVPIEIMGKTHYWIHPEKTKLTDKVADHLSDFNTCPLKTIKKYQAMQEEKDAGHSWIPSITPQNAITFGSGYARQAGLLAQAEEMALWHPEDFIYSPDGITNDRPHQIKEVRISPMTVADRKAGMSIEQHLMETRPFWFNYELQSMYLFGVTESYLTVWYLNAHDAMTFKITATPAQISQVGYTLDERIQNIRSHREASTLPSPSERLSMNDCTNSFGDICDFLHEQPCLDEVPRLDMIEISATNS